jgi:hypothetical protein
MVKNEQQLKKKIYVNKIEFITTFFTELSFLTSCLFVI